MTLKSHIPHFCRFSGFACIALLGAAVLGGFSGCSAPEQAAIAKVEAAFSADVKAAETWAQSGSGKLILGVVSNEATAWAAGQGPKTQANVVAQAVAAAPNPNGGLEVAAQQLDAVASSNAVNPGTGAPAAH